MNVKGEAYALAGKHFFTVCNLAREPVYKVNYFSMFREYYTTTRLQWHSKDYRLSVYQVV